MDGGVRISFPQMLKTSTFSVGEDKGTQAGGESTRHVTSLGIGTVEEGV
jgi:hypothetical protein